LARVVVEAPFLTGLTVARHPSVPLALLAAAAVRVGPELAKWVTLAALAVAVFLYLALVVREPLAKVITVVQVAQANKLAAVAAALVLLVELRRVLSAAAAVRVFLPQ
jgi:hypothetical protein